VGYTEHRVRPGVDVWRTTGAVAPTRVLPDGCVDLLFDGRRLLVAGPDTAARLHHSPVPAPMWGARLHAGLGPVLLGVPADELRDATVPLDQVWSDRRSRALTEQVAGDPARALAAWAASAEPPTFGSRLVTLLQDGSSVAAAADALGYSARQLQRRAVPAFGYGPQHLGRVLRLGRVLAQADRGLAWAAIAQSSGYADQAHLARDVRSLTGASPTALRRERVRSVQDAA
jgi:AraC-like DNA-binding protein